MLRFPQKSCWSLSNQTDPMATSYRTQLFQLIPTSLFILPQDHVERYSKSNFILTNFKALRLILKDLSHGILQVNRPIHTDFLIQMQSILSLPSSIGKARSRISFLMTRYGLNLKSGLEMLSSRKGGDASRQQKKTILKFLSEKTTIFPISSIRFILYTSITMQLRMYASTLFAFEIPITFNVFCNHNPNGLMYALKRNEKQLKRIKKDVLNEIAGKTFAQDCTLHDLARSLVLRANIGEHVSIKLENQIHFILLMMGMIKIQIQPIIIGSFKEKRIYNFKCKRPGAYLFHDAEVLFGFEIIADGGTNSNGLWRTLVCEPKLSAWRDFETGQWALNGLQSDVILHKKSYKPAPFFGFEPSELPNVADSYREYIPMFHDEMELTWFPPRPGSENPCGEELPANRKVHSINYRSEPIFHTENLVYQKYNEGTIDLNRPAVGEEIHHSSWMAGDPATPVFLWYAGDPVVYHVIHAAVKKTFFISMHINGIKTTLVIPTLSTV